MSILTKRASIIVFKALVILLLILGVGKNANAYILGSQPDSTYTANANSAVGDSSYTWSPPVDIVGTSTLYISFNNKNPNVSQFSCAQLQLYDTTSGFTGYVTPINDGNPDCYDFNTKKVLFRTITILPGYTLASTTHYYFVGQGGTTLYTNLNGSGALNYEVGTEASDVGTDSCIDGASRICTFSPGNNITLTGPTINFGLSAFINSTDTDGFAEHVLISLYNVDQNVLLIGASTGISLYNDYPPDGRFDFSTSTPLADGNYRLRACIDFKSPFNLLGVGDRCESHQFIVGQGTFIGNLSQNGYNELQTLFGSTTATTTNSASNCLPGPQFSIGKCGGYLFVPDAYYLGQTFAGFHDTVLTHVPWGYFTRVVDIMSDASSTVDLPSAAITIAMGSTTGATTTQISFNPGDMLSGAGTLLTDARDPIHGKNLRDVTEPMVQIMFAIAVLFTIITDLTGSHNHAHNEPAQQQGKKT